MLRSFNRKDITLVKMLTSPPSEVVNCGDRVINISDGFIYEFENMKWVKKGKATREDYQEIPQLID